MKKTSLFLSALLFSVMSFAATIEIPAEAADWNIPPEAIDVLQAREICAALDHKETTGTKYYVMGYVKRVSSTHAGAVADYGNARFYMENVKGANSEEEFNAYQVYGLNGKKITDPNVVAAGDFVILYGELSKYEYDDGDVSYQTVGRGAAHIWKSTNPLLAGSDTPDNPDTPDNMLTCAEAASIAAADNYKGTENVTVMGYVVELGQQKTDEKTKRLKQCFYMSDTNGGSKQFMAYWAFVPNYFQVGDKVAVTGILQNYKGTIEIADGEAVLFVPAPVENVVVENAPVKVIKNGQILIIRDDKVYNILGAQVK